MGQRVAPEGKGILLGTVALSLLSAVGGWLFDIGLLKVLALILIVWLVFCAYFFRNPVRIPPDARDLVLAPADGKVVFVGTIGNDPDVRGPAKQVSIFLSIFDAHANWVPVSGVVTHVKYRKGRFLTAFKREASEANEQTEIHIRTGGDSLIKVKQVAGLLARRILCYLREGDQVTTGARLGFIRFGSRTDLILPAAVRIAVSEGEKVKGGQSVVGKLA